MAGQHDAIISLPQFFRTLAFVTAAFAAALMLSWTIDAQLVSHLLM